MSILKFQDNTPAQVALKFPTGKHVAGKFGEQVMYSLQSGEVMYVPIILEKQLQELNVKAGEPVEILKSKRDKQTEWTAKRVSPIAPVLQEGAKTEKKPQRAAQLLNGEDLEGHHDTGIRTVLADALCTAVEAAHQAEQYSLTIGRPTTFDPRNITSMALTLVIGRSRERAA